MDVGYGQSVTHAAYCSGEQPAMNTHLKIDFVSDIVCPWCVIGLKALEQALEQVGGEISISLHFQPFELNPQMPAEGQDIAEHLAQKYGSTPEQAERSRAAIRQRGTELGFVFDMKQRSRVYNTFDAHRLLHWAETEEKQHALKAVHGLLHGRPQRERSCSVGGHCHQSGPRFDANENHTDDE
jgi:predicted DsbA family dithiol-disulfide isomerase